MATGACRFYGYYILISNGFRFSINNIQQALFEKFDQYSKTENSDFHPKIFSEFPLNHHSSSLKSNTKSIIDQSLFFADTLTYIFPLFSIYLWTMF